ncbi:hypothetical protein [Anaeromonas gelatinilytica]|nr:hypothetical protein [Anaeromonas gelatinilytica]
MSMETLVNNILGILSPIKSIAGFNDINQGIGVSKIKYYVN